MAEKVSSSNGLEQRPKLRFPGFDEPWKFCKAEDIFTNVVDKNHPTETVLTIIQGKGTLPREAAGRNIHYDNASLSGYKKVEKGDFIIHLRSFEGGLETANETGIVSPAYTILRPIDKVSTLFYDAYFHTDEFINHVLSKSVEGIRDGRQISYEAFKWLGIPYCDITEQEKISVFFEVLNARIDKQRQLVNSLKKYKRGVINRIFTSEDGKWKSIRLGDYVSIMRGGSPRPIDEYITTERNGVNWIKIGDAPSDALYVTKAKEKIKLSGVKKSRRVYTGDLILSNSMSFGRPYILKIDGCIHDGWLLIRDEQNLFDKRFLCYYLGSDIVISQYKRYAAGSCVNNLNSELVGDVEIHYPPLETQQYIAKILEALDSKIEIENSQFLQLEQMKSALMQQLFI